jgi:hypothetical protein
VFGGWRAVFSPDGKALAVANFKWDKASRPHSPTVRLVAPTTGKDVRALDNAALPGPKEVAQVEALAFSPDGKTLFAAGQAKSGPWVRGWATATGKALPSEPPVPRDRTKYPRPTLRAISPDGGMLALSYFSPEKEARMFLCDRATGFVTASFPALAYSSRYTIAFSPDGRTVAVGQGGAISVRECSTGLERRRFAALEGRKGLTCLAFSPDGRALVAGYYYQPDALVWDVTGRLRKGGKLSKARPSPARLAELWDELGGSDAGKAHKAVWELVAAPEQAVPFLNARLHLPKIDHKKVAKWVADLHDEQFGPRAAAAEGLEDLGLDAEAALRKELARKPSIDVVRRVDVLLGKLDGGLPPRPWLQVLRGLEVLEQIGTPAAQRVVERLADSSNESRLARAAQSTLHRLRLKNAR